MTVALASQQQFLAAVDRGACVALSAYVLSARSKIAAALERAGDRGARVSVTLEGAPYEDRAGGRPLALENQRTVAELRRHGVAARLTGPHDVPLHMKAAIVDGTAFLDDRNWPSAGADTLVSTNGASDVAAVASALGGAPVSSADLATEKSQALELEAKTIYAGSGDRVDVESESFGASVVSSALRYRAARGAHVRLIVAEAEYARADVAERASLARLAAAGVEVRVAREAEKLCVAGDRAWAGSANATFATAARPVLDWGMRISAPGVIDRLAAGFARTWQSASAVGTVAGSGDGRRWITAGGRLRLAVDDGRRWMSAGDG